MNFKLKYKCNLLVHNAGKPYHGKLDLLPRRQLPEHVHLLEGQSSQHHQAVVRHRTVQIIFLIRVAVICEGDVLFLQQWLHILESIMRKKNNITLPSKPSGTWTPGPLPSGTCGACPAPPTSQTRVSSCLEIYKK
jgi:hypothetical protein